MLLYVFQIIFPILTVTIILWYSCCLHWSIKNEYDEYTKNVNNWATLTAHAIICLFFILYVLALDIAVLSFRNHDKTTTAYYNTDHNDRLYFYTVPMLIWDVIATVTIILMLFRVLACCKETSTNKTSSWVRCVKWFCKNEDKRTLQSLAAAGVVPGLLCLASHAHYIIIAWVSDPIYATSIGIYYAIFYVLHLVVLKQTYKGIDDHDRDSLPQDNPPVNFNYKAMGVAFLVGCLTVSYQVLITVFVVYIPINHSVEDTPNRLSTIIQGVGAVFLGLIAYRVIVDPKGNKEKKTH